MQDLVAIAVAIVAGAWIARSAWRQWNRPACGQTDAPPGADGFVALQDVARKAGEKRSIEKR